MLVRYADGARCEVVSAKKKVKNVGRGADKEPEEGGKKKSQKGAKTDTQKDVEKGAHSDTKKGGRGEPVSTSSAGAETKKRARRV